MLRPTPMRLISRSSRWTLPAVLIALNGLVAGTANAAPQAADDAGNTPFEMPITIDVLTNDFSFPTPIDSNSVTIVSGPDDGIVSVDPITGEVDYLPDLGFAGTDSFAYTVEDTAGEVSNIAYVDITVDPPLPPVILVLNALQGAGSSWTFSGSVDYFDPDSLTIDFGSLLSGHWADVESDGSFSYTTTVTESGIVSAETTDDYEQTSNTEEVNVN